MTTKEVVQLAYNAQSVREDSWQPLHSCYGLTIDEAVDKAAPPSFSKPEKEVASLLNYLAWNEVQELYNDINW